MQLVSSIPKNKSKSSRSRNQNRQNPSASLTSYKGPTQLTNPLNNADADMITREIVEVIDITTLGAVAQQTFNFSNFPSGTSADFVAMGTLYNTYRTLSETITWIPNQSVCSTSVPNQNYTGIIVAKVARGDTAPALAAYTDIDTSCVIQPICSTKFSKLTCTRMSDINESEFSQTNAPNITWNTQITLFFGGSISITGVAVPAGVFKISRVMQFRAAL